MANQFTWQSTVVAITGLSPDSGPTAGGTAVTISGYGFKTGATVAFDGVAATSVVVISDNQITCDSPAHVAASINVVVTNTDATAASYVYTFEDTPSGFRLTYLAVGGLPASPRRFNSPISISQALGQPSTCQFTTDVEPVGDGAVSFAVNGVQLFSGTVTRKKIRYDENVSGWDTTTSDQSFQLRRSYPAGLTWINTPANSAITTLLSTFAPAFNINVDGTLTVPITKTLTGTESLDTVLTQLCDESGGTWFVDGVTVYVFNVTSPDGTISIGDGDVELGSVDVEWDYSQIRNRVTIYYGAQPGDTTQPFVTVDDPASQALYGVREYGIAKTNLDQVGATQYGQMVLQQYSDPIPNITFACRNVNVRAGKMLSSGLSALAGTFLIRGVQVSQFDEIDFGLVPLFTVTATPPNVPMSYLPPNMGISNVVQVLQQAVQTANQAAAMPTLSGAITSGPGVPAVLNPVTNDQLAGCIDPSKTNGPTKTPTAAATTGNITLSGAQTIDGVSVSDGDRVLVKDQTDPTQNGVYVASSSGAWTRASDAASNQQMPAGVLVPVANGGTTNGTTLWMMNATSPVTLGSTPLSFTEVSGGALAPTGVTAGTYGG